MNTNNRESRKRTASALTRTDWIITLAVVSLLAALGLAEYSRNLRGAQRIACVGCLKQVALSALLWANDHDQTFPFASTNANSSRAWVNSPQVFRHYQVMSNELTTPKVLVCSSDAQRIWAEDFVYFSNSNLSYFVGLDASAHDGQGLLAGDRNITGGVMSNGFQRVLTPKSEAGWTKAMHRRAGNAALADGSVQRFETNDLSKHLAAMTNASIRLAIP